jgi:hypothetical protein
MSISFHFKISGNMDIDLENKSIIIMINSSRPKA